ncbi:hypothetical protein RUM43_012969 [Polyplax serrata]|uniref:Uncharacterized protein n=1 Tax=Polyplax serrata TaxID=468196 RepID=A0AAN8NWB5_POLSC
MERWRNDESKQGFRYNFQGSSIVVEPSVAGGSKKRGSGGGDSDSPTEQLGNGWRVFHIPEKPVPPKTSLQYFFQFSDRSSGTLIGLIKEIWKPDSEFG